MVTRSTGATSSFGALTSGSRLMTASRPSSTNRTRPSSDGPPGTGIAEGREGVQHNQGPADERQYWHGSCRNRDETPPGAQRVNAARCRDRRTGPTEQSVIHPLRKRRATQVGQRGDCARAIDQGATPVVGPSRVVRPPDRAVRSIGQRAADVEAGRPAFLNVRVDGPPPEAVGLDL